MKKLIVLFTLLVMSTSAFAATYYLTGERYYSRTGIRYCYYIIPGENWKDGGHVEVYVDGCTCPSEITQ